MKNNRKINKMFTSMVKIVHARGEKCSTLWCYLFEAAMVFGEAIYHGQIVLVWKDLIS